MARKRHSAEEIVNKLRQAGVELAKGQTVAGVCKLLAVGSESGGVCSGRSWVGRAVHLANNDSKVGYQSGVRKEERRHVGDRRLPAFSSRTS